MSNFNINAAEFVPRFTLPPQQVKPPQPVNVVTDNNNANTAQPTQNKALVIENAQTPPQKLLENTNTSNNNLKSNENNTNESQPQATAAAAFSTTEADNIENKLKNLNVDEDESKDVENDSNWDNADGSADPTGDVAGASGETEEAAKAKPKKILVREYKPKKEPVNVIFCGHVDAGKSTIGGQIMYLTGMVDKRTLEKYEREAKEMNRESWYLSWALDTNDEEREKGKTVEVGRAYFETEKKHFIILDAPGHRGFVPNMIGGASQADIAVLVISARRGEFETGFEKGGQTREHAMLVKTAGVKHLVVLVNKMDDPTVLWDQTRYIEIVDKLTPYLKKCGFQMGKDVHFMPCSGFTGAFLKDPPSETDCNWYKGPCLIQYLEELPQMNRTSNGPVRMPIIDKYKDMGTIVLGKIESGMIRLNDKLVLMPNKAKVEVTNIYCEDDETDSAICGENVKLKLKGVEDTDVSSGFILCDSKDLCLVAKVFDAQVIILECPSIISPGFNAIMHLHTATVEVQLKAIIGLVDRKTGEKNLEHRPRFIKQDQIAICRFDIMGGNICCMEPFKIHQQLGRFTLRYENKTVAVGKVLKIIE